MHETRCSASPRRVTDDGGTTSSRCRPQLAEVVDQISYERVVMNAGTTWDYVPWHYDPEYAKGHGHPTIFVNTMHLAGFVDRIATDFGGSVQPGGAAQGVAARLDLRRRFDGGAWPRGRQAHRYRR